MNRERLSHHVINIGFEIEPPGSGIRPFPDPPLPQDLARTAATVEVAMIDIPQESLTSIPESSPVACCSIRKPLRAISFTGM